jgi:hypothetical protein
MGCFWPGAQDPEIKLSIVIYSTWEFPTLAPRGGNLISYNNLQHMGSIWPGTQDPEIGFSIVIYSTWEFSDTGPKGRKFNFLL